MKRSLLTEQIIPLGLTAVTAAVLSGILWLEIIGLNRFLHTGIVIHLRWWDVGAGLVIYLKTSIDFAIFIARLMEHNRGWKGRVAVEIGTAAGNAGGTLIVLAVWSLFREVTWLLAIMILLAALVLFQLAEEGLEHTMVSPGLISRCGSALLKPLRSFNNLVEPVLRLVIPNTRAMPRTQMTFWSLFLFSCTIPFILGLDDFAGYVPLFSLVNVFGFAVGVFAGHMVLNALLYLSPERTVAVVKNSFISLIGSIAFIGLAFWGIVEVIKLLF
jgi:hypothetical protein